MITCGHSVKLRHELKYVVGAQRALALRDFVRSYLELEEFGVGKPNFSYQIHTLYMDSPGHKLFWQGLTDPEHRHQLRIRFYTDHPDAPVHFEHKRWLADAVVKSRAEVHRQSVHWLLAGQLPESSWLLSRTSRDMTALQEFLELQERIGARPILHVAFLREGYESHDGQAWITLDRHVTCELDPSAAFTVQFQQPHLPFDHEVLVKLKYRERFPDWFRELVETFGLSEQEWDLYLQSLAVLRGCNYRRVSV